MKYQLFKYIVFAILLYFSLFNIFIGYDGSIWWIALFVIICISVLVLGSIFIQWNFYLPSINSLKKDAGTKKILLSFDDGPTDITLSILDILKRENVPAIFFIIGKNIKGNEAILKRMIDEGHTIGNHSYQHGFNFDWQSSKEMQLEIDQCNQAIEGCIGQKTTLFRPPYGVTNPNLSKAIKYCGMQSVGWSLRSMDTKAKNKDKLLQKIVRKAKDGDIILLHDRCEITANILPELIVRLRSKGFKFVSQIS